jgi:hypothetical protein
VWQVRRKEIAMKSVVGALLVALLLFAGGALAWNQAAYTRRVADAHQRLATLHYDEEEGLERTSVLDRVPFPGSLDADVERHQATITYWLSRYQALTELTSATGPQAPADPELLLVAANAAFRASAPQSGDRRAAVERLDGVIQAYADVLRKAPTLADAAFNYEFVARLRDSLAKAPPSRAARDKKPEAADEPGFDLPVGPTVHGRPGGPPEGTDMSDFKTLTPMRFDEREEQMDPGRGRKIQRKG